MSTISKPPKSKDELLAENKRVLQEKRKEFTKAWDDSKPSINMQRLIKKFQKQSKVYCDPMLISAMKLLGIISAVGYANDELSKGIDPDTSLSEGEIKLFASKMLRLKILEIVAESMDLDAGLLDRIIGIQIAKDFGQVSGPAPINAPPVVRKKPLPKVNSNAAKSVLLRKRPPAKAKA